MYVHVCTETSVFCMYIIYFDFYDEVAISAPDLHPCTVLFLLHFNFLLYCVTAGSLCSVICMPSRVEDVLHYLLFKFNYYTVLL